METQRKDFKYETLTKTIEEKIKEGVYQVGDKLPSIRNLHKQSNLSIITVNRAFLELERLGLIEARPKSGYYVKPPDALRFQKSPFISIPTQPAKVALSQLTNSILTLSADPNLLPLASAVLPPEKLPNKYFHRVLKSLSAKELDALLGYGTIEGDYELRRQIAQRDLTGVLQPKNLIITNGCIEAIAICLTALLKPGDTIAIESPTYFLLLQLLQELGVMVVEVPTSRQYGFKVEAFEEVLKTTRIKACLLTPNFNNPLGSLMPDDQKAKLAALAQKHDFFIIEDAIYSEIYFQKSKPASLRAFDKKGLVLTCSSFSKTAAPGMRIGWVATTNRFKEKITKMKGGVSISTALLNQHLLSQYLKFGSYDQHLRRLRKYSKKQTMLMTKTIKDYFPKGTQIVSPQGGFTLWIELPPIVDSADVFHQALQQKILIVPGIICSNSRCFKNYIRLSCSAPYTEEIEKGIITLGKLIKSLAS